MRRETIEKLTKKGTVLEKGDGSWMLIETANNWVDNGIGR